MRRLIVAAAALALGSCAQLKQEARADLTAIAAQSPQLTQAIAVGVCKGYAAAYVNFSVKAKSNATLASWQPYADSADLLLEAGCPIYLTNPGDPATQQLAFRQAVATFVVMGIQRVIAATFTPA